LSRKTRKPQGPVDTPAAHLFATGARQHQAGQLREAEKSYRDALTMDQNHAPSLHYLGVLALQTRHNLDAVDLIGRSIAIDAQNPESHYNIALALRMVGRHDDTIAHLRRAIALKPDYAAAWLNLGNALRESGDPKGAIEGYRAVLRLHPDAVEAQFNIANIDAEQGRHDAAIAGYQRALQLKGDHAQAHNNLGTLLLALGRPADAVMHFRQAVRFDPGLAEAHLNLGGALVGAGELGEAMGVIRRACEAGVAETRAGETIDLVWRMLQAEENADTRALFVACARSLRALPTRPFLPATLHRALTEPWGPPADLAAAGASVVRQNPVINGCIERAAAAWPRRLGMAELFGASGETAVVRDPLLRALLNAAPVRDAALERFLTSARLALLDAAEGRSPPGHHNGDFLGLACALAQQCFLNEYAFGHGDLEIERVRVLRNAVVTALDADKDIAPLCLPAIAAYEPLDTLADAARLLLRHWPSALAPLLDTQIREPREEAALRDALPSLTATTEAVSLKVRERHEQNPSPRWVTTAAPGPAATLEADLAERFSRFLPGERAATDALIAGCGTGQHAATVAMRFPGLRILAIDLSFAALAYAQRATRLLGLDIAFAQADLLRLGGVDRTFDMIDASGVLHHLADPFAGWQVLLSLLRPGGVMRLALHSARGRQDVATVREFVARREFASDAESIRQCRRELMNFAVGTPQRMVAEMPDFFATSACRDLLFPVQEHALTLSQISTFLDTNALAFLGFEGAARGSMRYAQRHPGDAARADLAAWDAIEREEPRLFAAMYQFWVQKPH